MKEQIKIAIFGLSLNIQDSIKQKIVQMYDDTLQINWVSIRDQEMDILLVNDLFFGSSAIQNLVQTKKIPYLRLVTDEQYSGSIQGDTLYLPFVLSDQIRGWFKDRYLKVPVRDKAARSPRVQAQAGDIHKVIQAFFNERNGTIQVFDGNGNMALMNTKTEQVWLDPDRKIKGTDHSLNYTYATMQMTQSVSGMQGLDLRSWLWNTLWYSTDLIKDVSVSTFYQLEYWPQTDAILERMDMYKMAACFEKGANVLQVQAKTGLSKERIKKFVAVALLSQAMKAISAEDASLIGREVVEPKGRLKALLGRFRKKDKSAQIISI